MSIFFQCGKPGSGKSYMAVRQICEELRTSDRFIVTNIELNMAELATYCHDNFDAEVNLRDRIRILDESECGQFWLYEPGRDFLKRRTIQMATRSVEVPDFEDRAKRGCLYVIDECHLYYGARDWQQTGTDCTFFLSQHRKLRADVIFVTQHPEQCDKALRRLSQEYCMIRNLSREPIYGFRLCSLFRYARMLNSPSSPDSKVFESGFVKLEPEVYGKLYDTMQGVGIAGRVVAHKEERGRSLWWLLIPIVAVCFLVWYGPGYMAKAGGAFMGKMVHRVTDVTDGKKIEIGKAFGAPSIGTNTAVITNSVVTNAISQVLVYQVSTNIFLVGRATVPGYPFELLYYLSDGSVYQTGDGHVEQGTGSGVRIDGVVYTWKPRATFVEQSQSEIRPIRH
jgi:hypothetical protein